MKKLIITTCLIILAVIGGGVFYFYINPPCLGLGCTGDYSFQDTAYYRAPNSNLEVMITTSGFVPNGADLGDGKSSVKMYSTHSNSDTIFLKNIT